MKHYLRLINTLLVMSAFLCGTSFCLCAQEISSRYLVFKVSGQVKVLTSTVWQPVQRKQPVSLRSQFLLNQGDRLGVLDTETHRVYYAEKMGKFTLAQLISQARKQADRITGLVNKQLNCALNDAQKSNQTIAGASYRGQEDNEVLQNLYATLINQLNESETYKTPNHDKCFTSEYIVSAEGDTFYFKLRNNSPKALYVNVLMRTNKGLELAFPLGYTCNEPFMLLPSNSEVEVKQFAYALPSYLGDNASKASNDEVKPFLEFIPFATPYAFDSQALQLLLQQGAKISCPPKDELIEVYWAD